jgi:hypothetical protein
MDTMDMWVFGICGVIMFIAIVCLYAIWDEDE